MTVEAAEDILAASVVQVKVGGGVFGLNNRFSPGPDLRHGTFNRDGKFSAWKAARWRSSMPEEKKQGSNEEQFGSSGSSCLC